MTRPTFQAVASTGRQLIKTTAHLLRVVGPRLSRKSRKALRAMVKP